MNDELQFKIQAWVDAELSGWQARRVEQLVESDADAKALATELRYAKTAITGNETTVAVPELREFYWNKIRLQIEREDAAGTKRVSPAPAWDPLSIFRRIALPLAGLAVVCAVAMVSVNQFTSATSDESSTFSEMDALTFHDQTADMTVVWLQDNSNNDQQPAQDENSSDGDDVI